MSRHPPRRLAVFSDDWGRHPSSCQHLTGHLLGECEVHWLNTIGMRVPALDAYALRRAAGKLGAWLRAGVAPGVGGDDHAGRGSAGAARGAGAGDDAAPGNAGAAGGAVPGTGTALAPRVHAPLMWPSFRSRPGRALNQRLLSRALDRALGADPAAAVLTTLPILADVATADRRRWVYYCVDDFSEWPGMDRPTMLAMEGHLVARADAIVVASETLGARISAMGRESTLLTHGVDVEHWQRGDATRWDGFAGLEPPWLVFWGVVDERLDVDWVAALSGALRAGSIVFIGPHNNPAPRLAGLPRVHFLPPVAFERLPDVAAGAHVLLMPYADLPVTRAMQPLKLKEYLATGRPVVVRALPATREWADCCDVLDDAAAFAATVQARAAASVPVAQLAARERLAAESWASKAVSLAASLFPPSPRSLEP